MRGTLKKLKVFSRIKRQENYTMHLCTMKCHTEEIEIFHGNLVSNPKKEAVTKLSGQESSLLCYLEKKLQHTFGTA